MLDLTLAGARYDAVRGAVETLAASPDFDIVLAALGSSARTLPETAIQPLIECDTNGKTLAACLIPEAPESLVRCVRAGIPAFRTPESCADALTALRG